MSRQVIHALIVSALAILTGLALALHIPQGEALAEFALQALVFATLTVFALYFDVLLSEIEVSPAHVIGMVAFLSLPVRAIPVMTWALFMGGVIGGILLVTRTSDLRLLRRFPSRTMHNAIVTSALVTLSYMAAGQVYLQLGGDLRLRTPLSQQFVPLLAYAIVYCLVYLAILLLEIYRDGRSIPHVLRQSGLSLAAMLILGTPFGILSALLVSITPTSLLIFVIGAVLVALGLYGLSRTQYQLRKQLSELRTLSVVGQALQSNLKLSSLLNTVYLQVVELLNIDYFVVALNDPQTRRLHFPLALRHSVEIGQTPDGKALIDHVMRTQAPLLISRDVTARARELGLEPPRETWYSWLGVPLIAGGKLLGAIVVVSDHPQRLFTTADLRLLNIVTANASIAIDNAQLYEQQTARVGQLSNLNRVLSLLTGTLSSNTILDIVISSATVISDATAVAAYLYWDADTLALARSTGLSARFTSDPAFPLIKAAQQKPVLIENADTDPRVSYYPPLLMQEEKAAWAELPLAVGETGVGVIVFYYDEPQTFTEDRVEILRAFAGQAAQAIKNARQYSTTDEALENQVKQMYTLANLGRQLTATMNMTAIGDLVLARALEMCHATAGLIIIRHDADWIILAQSGDLPTPLLPLTVQQTITGQVLQTGQPIRYHDIRQETAYPALNRSTRSQLTVPVLRNSATLGAITLESDRIGEFSEEDSYFVTQLANQMVIAIDNTRLFEDIAEARDQLAVIVNAVTDGMILIDKTGNIALANPRVDLIGLKSEQLLNQNIEGLLEKPELDLAERLGFQSDQKLRKLLKELRAADSWVGVEPHSYTVESDNKTRHIQREVIPIPGADGEPEGMLLVIYDETEQKELAQMRQDLSDMLVHDLRSPLSAVTTGLKLLREVVPPDNDLRPVVESTTETSQRAIRKLMSRVNSLLDISKMQNGQVSLETEPTELTTLADNVCLELNPLAQELSVLLKSQVDDHLPPLAVDADKVERVLQNLVDNALKFAPAETTVTIRSYPPGADGAAPQYVRIDVIDEGPGVPDEYKERLFERFVQIKGRRGTRRGSGLGLTFCRLVVEAHGGRIWVEDNPTGGSIFALTLPLTNLTRFDETGEHPALNNLPHS